ncbi:hypothetical protein [Psychrobacter sp. M13]|uniref:hypothetical protein n=1 Tax=Psychrobacter sp. M13 TaxID=3067275 RepID=UPI00273CC6A7|nr:hypothetical protein [Psychrobacter sp. M13]WLP94199.1 hypothetical protein Q9G97_11520 [Psychrobacter sp. M13]
MMYQTDLFHIETSDFELTSDHFCEMVDFNLHYDNKKYFGSGFTTKHIDFYLNSVEPVFNNYFWCTSSIVIKDFTVDSLISALEDIFENPTVSLEDIFTRIE